MRMQKILKSLFVLLLFVVGVLLGKIIIYTLVAGSIYLFGTEIPGYVLIFILMLICASFLCSELVCKET